MKLYRLAVCILALCRAGLCQTLPPVILEIDVEKQVDYITDVFDYDRLASGGDATTTPLTPIRTFGTFVNIADVVAVNGRDAKGTAVSRQVVLRLTPTPALGQTIADTTRTSILDFMWEIMSVDGTPIGTIMASGMNFGASPPGAPKAAMRDNMTITGGTGAYLGARGQVGSGMNIAPARAASVLEDPANRRTHAGGGARRVVVHLIPLFRPEILAIASGPAVFHADFTPVTPARPARSGEVLIALARGMGPTRPSIDPGQAFPDHPLHVVNSPVEVTLNGKVAELLYAGGYPGAVDIYQINFRPLEGLAAGPATVQLAAAWIPGSSITIPFE